MTADDKVQTITDRAAGHAIEQHDPDSGRRRTLVRVAAVILFVSLLGGGWWVASRLDNLQGQADTNARIAVELGDQVRDLGGTPRVDPPSVDDPDPDDPDPDDPERQDAEVQDPETQDPEQQDPEVQESETPDVERDDPDPDDPEIQNEEIQDQEVDDPDPDDPAVPPAGWTWIDPAGRQQSCTRTGGTDNAPTYTCTAEPPPETVPGGPPPLPIGG